MAPQAALLIGTEVKCRLSMVAMDACMHAARQGQICPSWAPLPKLHGKQLQGGSQKPNVDTDVLQCSHDVCLACPCAVDDHERHVALIIVTAMTLLPRPGNDVSEDPVENLGPLEQLETGQRCGRLPATAAGRGQQTTMKSCRARRRAGCRRPRRSVRHALIRAHVLQACKPLISERLLWWRPP